MGKVNLINIYPLTFGEFLEAVDSGMYEYYNSINRGQKIESIFHNKLIDLYNYYIIIGGMPECVYSWITEKNPERIMQIQSELVTLYESDFSKHNGSVNSGRILMVFRSIVTQLAKDNEKFVYGIVKKGGRAREFEEAIEWLVSAGMIIRIYNVSKPEHPLTAFQQLNHFKLFIFDVGLLKFMAGISNEAVILKADYQFKGALTENFVLQQLREIYDTEPKYYAPTPNKEIDFLLQEGVSIIPVEVKAGESVRTESFSGYINKYKPEKAVKYSKLGYEINDRFTNIPLYLVGRTKDLI